MAVCVLNFELPLAWVGESVGNSDAAMFGNVTALEGLHVTGNYRDKSMQHTCSRHAAWDLTLKDFQFKSFLAMEFTTQHVFYLSHRDTSREWGRLKQEWNLC